MSPEPVHQRPYLLRAMHAWMTDNGQTPHIVVDATIPGLEIPTQYVRDGKIVLNVSLSATTDLDLGNEAVCFNARFSGVQFAVRVPVRAVLGIYARESGKGMIFSEDEFAGVSDEPPDGDGGAAGAGGGKRPHLTVVK